MKNLVVLSGAGISAESGVKTFRDSGGLWEGHDVMKVASPQGWEADQELVLDFYNKRRAQLLTVKPNDAHHIIAGLERNFHVDVITQNVDDLHERAGSSNVLHLHGELLKVRSVADPNLVMDWTDDLKTGDLGSDGKQLRPHVVWFGEAVPAMEPAMEIARQADFFVIVGTSLQVYPAAGLSDFTPSHCELFLVDPNPSINSRQQLTVYPEKATTGMQKVADALLDKI